MCVTKVCQNGTLIFYLEHGSSIIFVEHALSPHIIL